MTSHNSDKRKTETTALNISYYTLHKIHGTRFLNYRRRALKNLSHKWPALITGFQNVLAKDCGLSKETRAKI